MKKIYSLPLPSLVTALVISGFTLFGSVYTASFRLDLEPNPNAPMICFVVFFVSLAVFMLSMLGLMKRNERLKKG